MTRKLTRAPRAHGRRYPWAKWFRPGGTSTVLTRGVHFDIHTHSMANLVRKASSRMGIQVMISVGEGRIQITPKERSW